MVERFISNSDGDVLWRFSDGDRQVVQEDPKLNGESHLGKCYRINIFCRRGLDHLKEEKEILKDTWLTAKACLKKPWASVRDHCTVSWLNNRNPALK